MSKSHYRPRRRYYAHNAGARWYRNISNRKLRQEARRQLHAGIDPVLTRVNRVGNDYWW